MINKISESTLTIFASFSLFIINLDVAFVFPSFLTLIQLFLYILTNCIKNLSNVDIIFGAALNKINAIFLGQPLSLFESDLSIFFAAIGLVPNNDFAHIFGLRLIDLFQPVFDVSKSFAISDRVNHNDACSTFVVSLSYSLESFLTSSVPNLHFYLDTLDIDCLYLKIHTNRRYMRHLILLINISQENVSFPNC